MTKQMRSKLPLYLNNFQVDHNIKLSLDEDAVLELLQKEPTSEVDQERPFPTDYDMANLAYYAYKDAPVDKTPQHGWKFLLSAKHCGVTNGYYGDVFYNANQQQIVVAHRGTKLTNLGALYTDYKGIYLTNVVPQVNSALTLTNFAIELVKKLNGDNERKWFWQLSFTGHSLGGWLAQLSAFYAKYLTIYSAHFIKNETGGYHAHCVAFDSPGCKPILQKIKDGLKMRQSTLKDMSLSNLDITNYLYSPNLVNTTNLHVGTLLKFTSNIDNDSENISKISCCCCQYVSLVSHTFSSHGIRSILQFFDKEMGYANRNSQGEFEIAKVIDFPAFKKECIDYYTSNQMYKDYVILETLQDTKSSQKRYFVVKHRSDIIDFKVFSWPEINLLTRFEWSLQIVKYSNVVLPKHPEVDDFIEKLRNLVVRIDTRREYIKCKGFNECQKLVRIIKLSFHSSQFLNELSKTLSNDVKSINQIIYKYESNEYLKKIKVNVKYFAANSSNDNTSQLKSFFDSKQQIFLYDCQMPVPGIREVYQTFNAVMHETDFNKDNYLFLSMDNLLSLNAELPANDLVMFSVTVRSIKHSYLIVIDVDTRISEEVIRFVHNLCSNVAENDNVKVIFVFNRGKLTKQLDNELFGSFQNFKFDPDLHGDLTTVPVLTQRQNTQYDNTENIYEVIPLGILRQHTLIQDRTETVTHFVSRFQTEEWGSAIDNKLTAIKLLVFKDDFNRCFDYLFTQNDLIERFYDIEEIVTLIDWFIRINVDITSIFNSRLRILGTTLKAIVYDNKSQLILSTLLFADAENCRKYIKILDNDDDMGNIYEFADRFKMFLSQNYSHLALLIQSCKEKCVTDIAKNLKILSSNNKLRNYDGKLDSWVDKTVCKQPFIIEACNLNSLLTFVEDSIFCLKSVNDVDRSFCSIVMKNPSVKTTLLQLYAHLVTHCLVVKH